MSKAVITLSGTVGRDADIKQTSSGFMAKFPVATNARQKDRDGNWGDIASWFDVMVFAKNEEYLRGQYFKGAKCFVSGELIISQWTDRDGNKRMTPQVTANHAEGLTRSADSQVSQQRQQSRPAQQKQSPSPEADFDDDIPF